MSTSSAFGVTARPGDLQVARPVAFGLGQFAAAHVDLHRRQDQGGHAQRGIACGAHGDELLLADTAVDMHVVLALGGDGGLVEKLLTPGAL